MVAFVRWELHCPEPLLRPADLPRPRVLRRQRRARADVDRVRAVLLLRQRVRPGLARQELRRTPASTSCTSSSGFVIMAQIGGRILDRRGARPPIVLGSALGAVGFYLLAGKLTDLSLGKQISYDHDRGRRARADARPGQHRRRQPGRRSTSYSEVTGITQTARNFGASLGLAVLGTILISRNRANVATGLTKAGVPSGARTGSPRLHFSASSSAIPRTSPPVRPRRPARLRPLDPDRLLHHGRRDGRDLRRRHPLPQT